MLNPLSATQIMIISHKHKLIFIKPRKVAGTSFEIALSRFLGEDDVVTPITPKDEKIRASQGFVGPRNYLFDNSESFVAKNKKNKSKVVLRDENGKITRFFNHCTAHDIKSHVDESTWDKYGKISIVRNPWDRAVSLFHYATKKKNLAANTKRFTKFFKTRKNTLTQNHPMYFIDGSEVIDFYIKYENLEADIRALEKTYPALGGLWDIFQSITAKGDFRDKRLSTSEIFEANPEIDDLIRQRNAWDIEKFSYRSPITEK